ncbi:hypothetical protein PV328_001067 [Microctonus aethiopoides]|uniref:Uncharacterized protein n=1 Tax=Microctonus aethiopoides TaxID=144406 RepID=A0AA39FW61_9HYME|nr:hypothetical protein PV328_001067 [Microctonus aethiopoides]
MQGKYLRIQGSKKGSKNPRKDPRPRSRPRPHPRPRPRPRPRSRPRTWFGVLQSYRLVVMLCYSVRAPSAFSCKFLYSLRWSAPNAIGAITRSSDIATVMNVL